MKLRPHHCLVSLAVLATACASGTGLRLDQESMASRLQAAREVGAYHCAPKELAMAETQNEFLRAELDRGDSRKALAHRDRAREALIVVIEKSKGCQPKKPEPKKVEVAPVKDGDGDGVPDENDACPKTPGPEDYLGCPDGDGDGIPDHTDRCPDKQEDFDGVEDEDGCPEEEDRDGDGIMDNADDCPDVSGPIENKGCPFEDRDRDGLIDSADKCPDEPEDKDKFEDEDGCPDNDNDGDGVPDAEDKCPVLAETRNGFQDEDGCPDINPELVVVNRELGKIEIKQKIYFNSGKSRIKPVSYPLLNEVASALKANETIEVLIEGHTDSQGSDSYNMRLSDKRAKAVREYLIGQGISPTRMRSLGFGETKPVADNSTRDGREQNRRVEFTITKE